MRILFLLLMIIPFCARAQINKSAIQLAHENVDEYVTSKLFRNKFYTSVSFGILKERKDPDKETVWEMDHVFVIEEKHSTGSSASSTKQAYRFTFYFDNKMNITKAESSE
jgi:hypothetical protein